VQKLSLLFAGCVLSVSLSAQDADCVLKKDNDGVKVYTCKSDTSKFRSLKAEFSVQDVSIAELKTFLFTVPKYLNWQYHAIEANLVKAISDSEMIYRVVIDAPWPLDNREMVVQFTADIKDQDNAKFTINSVASDYPQNEDLIRVPFSQASWTITRANNTLHVIYKMNIDPGGYVPPLLVNIAMADGPHQSFRNLKKLIEKK
jgi:hypothetical protein